MTTTNKLDTKLRRCPFCGGIARIAEWMKFGRAHFTGNCTRCDATATDCCNAADAVEAWNKRDHSAEAAQPVSVPDGMTLVTREDGNNYCRILSALGMEEEGDPVAEVKRLHDLAGTPQVPEPVSDAVVEAMVRAHDREDAAQKGEPDPWAEDFPEHYRSERMAAMRCAIERLQRAAAMVRFIGIDRGSADGDCTVKGHMRADGVVVIDSVEHNRPAHDASAAQGGAA